MSIRALILFLSFACVASPGLAKPASMDFPVSDSRIKVIRYDENDVYKITTQYGYQTNIVFDRSEAIDTISVGDRSLWQIIPVANRLFIRPMQQGISTNMTLITNKRSYQFDIKSLGAEDKDDDVVYVAKFIYTSAPVYEAPPMPPPPPPPPPVAQSPAPPPVVQAPAPSPVAPSAIYTNYNYTYSGPDTLAPLQVFDNGDATFIKYLEVPSPVPNIYTIDDNGNKMLVTAEKKDNLLVVYTVAKKIELEHPDGNIIVYNEMLNANF